MAVPAQEPSLAPTSGPPGPGTLDLPRTLMLLGSGELGKEVAIAAQRLGCRVVAVDRYPDAPAMAVAHCAEVVAMTDPEALPFGLSMGELQTWTLVYLGLSSLAFVVVWVLGYLRR